MDPNKERLLLALLEDSSSSSNSDSDEENYQQMMCVLLTETAEESKTRIPNYISLVRQYSDLEFRRNFRVSRKVSDLLTDTFANSQHFLKCTTHGGTLVKSAECHIYSFLWFAAKKTCLRDTALPVGIWELTLSRLMDRVLAFLIEVAPKFIYFPRTEEEKEKVSHGFETISGFPGVIGCIDGTYISIRSPAHKLRSNYVNRHDQVALTLQGICDASGAFLDDFTGISSKINDARVYKMSFVCEELPALCGSDFHLLGDSTYPLTEWLLTPYKDYGNLTPRRRAFNLKLSATRVKIENAYAYLKQRFRQLIRLDFNTVDKASQFIVACCVLHNLCIRHNDFADDFSHDVNADIPRDEQAPVEDRQGDLRVASAAKRERIALSFSN